MSYQVLARKWRPRDFSQMVGQRHVVQALANAFDAGRLHHAYLFAGTRGVGKTTLGRIVAKCLNCEAGVGSRPCGQCAACREIDEGRFIDLVEVDAASRSKVDETRDLMDNVQYAPTRGRYKVYLIDEVHMFSEKSFNALLKTLEEPPPHVKFVLATTDPQKLPITVLSRCLQFNLRQLPASEIGAHLERIAAEEGVEAEPAALRLLARAARGSMRDALSLLDQALAFGAGRVGLEETRAMLGALDDAHVEALLEALAAGDAAALLARVEEMQAQATDFDEALAGMLSALQAIATAQVVPEAATEDDAPWAALAARIAPEDVQLWYQIALLGRRDLPFSPEPRGGFEMTLLRMLAFRPFAAGDPAAPPAGQGGPGAPPPGAGPGPGGGSAPADRAAAGAESRSAPPPAAGRQGQRGRLEPAGWVAAIEEMALGGLVRELASNCELIADEGTVVRLRLAPGHRQLARGRVHEKLAHALEHHLGRSLRLDITIAEVESETPARVRERAAEARHAAAVAAVRADEGVQAICALFDTEVDERRVRVIDGGEGT